MNIVNLFPEEDRCYFLIALHNIFVFAVLRSYAAHWLHPSGDSWDPSQSCVSGFDEMKPLRLLHTMSVGW